MNANIMIKNVISKFKNLFGLSPYPMGRHIYSYILDLTIEERSELKNRSNKETLVLLLSSIFMLLGFFYILVKVIE